MAGRRTKDTRLAGEMRQLLEEFDASGLSVTAFAKERGIAKARIWYWRKRLREDEKTAPARVMPVTVVPDPVETAPDLSVEVRGGRRILVSADFDADALKRLVLTLEAC